MILPTVYKRTRQNCTELQSWLLIYGRVILGLSPQGKKIYCGCSRARFYEDYLDLRRRKKEKAGGNCILRSFRICTSSKYYYSDQIMRMIRLALVELAANMLHSYGISVRKPVGRGCVEGMHKRNENINNF